MMTVHETSSPTPSFLSRVSQPFRPPFIGLAPVIWLYFVGCYLLYPDSYVLRGAFIESDNYTYLAQTLDWLKGQGWFDNVQHRLAPPEGTFIHYTRLAELPMALFTELFHLTGLPWIGAATLGAMLYPPLLLFALFWAARWVAESFVPQAWARVTAYIILFSQSLLFQFSLGHVGHRAPVAILIVLAVGCVNRMMLRPAETKWGVRAGCLLAFALAMALESLPWVLVLSAWVGLWLVVLGRMAARSAALFGLSLLVASAVFLAVYRPLDALGQREILSYSIVYVALAACIALCCLSVAWVARFRPPCLRYLTGIVVAAGSGGLFLHAFPELIAGPYGGMDKDLAQIFFTYIAEARPLGDVIAPWIVLVSLAVTLFALGLGGWFLYRAKRPERWLWVLVVALLATAIALTVFYQSRFFRYANLFSIIPLTVFLQRGWLWIGGHCKDRVLLLARVGILLAAGPLFPVLLPAMIDGRPFETGVLMFPMRTVRNACDLYPIEGLLQAPDYFGKKSLLILNTMSTGPEILFRTRHSVMAAPYHYNVRGNLDAVHFFGALDMTEAEALARQDKIDLVLICKSALDIYRSGSSAPRIVGHAPEGSPPNVIEQLLSHQTPPWLREVALPPSVNFMLFEMRAD